MPSSRGRVDARVYYRASLNVYDRLLGLFGDMIKYVVDVERGVIAIGGELHADAEGALLEPGQEQSEHGGRGRGDQGAHPGPHLHARLETGSLSEMAADAGLAPERWATFSRDQQVLMIANEMNRAAKLTAPADRERLRNAYARALQLTDLTVGGSSRASFRRELLRWRDLVAAL